jgi:hypothetical protein
MQENLKETAKRLVERRKMQLDELEVMTAVHKNKESKAESEEDKAKVGIVLSQLERNKESVIGEIKDLEELL